jgi:adenylate cyclase
MSTAALGVLVLLGLAAALLAVDAWGTRRRMRLVERLVADQARKLEQIQTEFGRFAPADVVDRLTDSSGALAPGRREVTVMFADLRGFTPLSERMDPGDMVGVLNGYFEAMTQAIAAHHGRVNQFMGDGLLALFGALEPNPWQARDAVCAALEMRKALAGYNGELAARGMPTLRFGIGIHTGEVVAGVMGNQSLSAFAVVGDTVNTAARVEQLTRLHDTDVLITDAVRRMLDSRFRLRELPPAPVKGKEYPVRTYAVEGMDDVLAPAAQHSPPR